ncbi:dephospho-CoA kinase [Hungatella effluvii]|uniref:dephospho-CoA kinase n=1 Tax=Hungatella effluvii TaxID=1096246 RepID=UPI0032E513B6
MIGLTGGVGAGKSRILDILQTEYGAEIIVADQVAHELMKPGHEGYEMVVRALGNSFLKPDGTIDRPLLSALIFHDQNALETMNEIIHPMVWKTIKDKICSSQADLIVVESAIMGREQDDIYDEMWYVYTSEENRIRRLKENRGYSRERSLSIMKNQLSDEEFRELADRVIDNNGTVEEVKAGLEALLKDKGRET